MFRLSAYDRHRISASRTPELRFAPTEASFARLSVDHRRPASCELRATLNRLGTVFKISRCFVRWKSCLAKATEVEAGQRPCH